MKNTIRNYVIIFGSVIITLFTSCQGASIPATPDVDSLSLWGNKDSSVIVNRIGKGTSYAMALSPDGTTIAVTGLLSVSTYNFNSLKEIWTSPIEQAQPPLTTGRGSVTWSPDSGQLATLSEIGISVWDAKTGERLHIFKGSQYSNVSSLVWTRDSRVAALESHLGQVLLWDIQTGRELFNFNTNVGVNSVDWMQRGDILAVALSNGEIARWDVHAKEQLHSLLKVCDDNCFYSLEWSPDGTRLASADKPDKVIIWDTQTGEQLFANESPVNNIGIMMAWSPDNNYLARAFDNGTIIVWDEQTGKQLHTLKRNQVRDLAWSPDGKNLISLSQYESVTVWDIQTGEQLRSLDEHTSWVLDLTWSPDGNMLASGSEDGEVSIWESSSGKKLLSFRDPTGWVRNVTWSPDGKQLASGGQSTITIWKAQTGRQLRVWQVDTQALFGLTWSPDGSMLASLSYDGTAIIWNASTGEQLLSLKRNIFSESLVWSPQGELLGTSYPLDELGRDQVTLWDPETGDPILTQPGLRNLAWSPLGDIVASIWDNETKYGRDDTTLVLWDPKTGKEMRRFDTGIFLSNIVWSPDGKFLIVGEDKDTDRSLIVLDAQAGEELHRLKGHYDAVTKVAWSPRGDLIASSSWDGTIIIWGIKAR